MPESGFGAAKTPGQAAAYGIAADADQSGTAGVVRAAARDDQATAEINRGDGTTEHQRTAGEAQAGNAINDDWRRGGAERARAGDRHRTCIDDGAAGVGIAGGAQREAAIAHFGEPQGSATRAILKDTGIRGRRT